MKREYDFTGGVRGKFYRADTQLRLPVYLDAETGEYVAQLARRRRTDASTIVNRLLRREMSAPAGQ